MEDNQALWDEKKQPWKPADNPCSKETRKYTGTQEVLFRY